MLRGVIGTLLIALLAASTDRTATAAQRIPVILDTDIGDDIDDSWAPAMLLKSPRYGLKLATTTFAFPG
jgi:hypothetical protein